MDEHFAKEDMVYSPWVEGNKDIALVNYVKLDNSKIYEKNSIVFDIGDITDGIYYLHKGEVKLSLLSSEGDEKIIFFICPGSFFGEATFFNKQPSLLQVRTTKKSIISYFKKEIIHELLTQENWFNNILINALSKKSLIVASQLINVIYENVLFRINQLLHILANKYGIEMAEGIAIKITQGEIANILGIHRVTVTKALNQMELDGIIKKTRSTIILKCS